MTFIVRKSYLYSLFAPLQFRGMLTKNVMKTFRFYLFIELKFLAHSCETLHKLWKTIELIKSALIYMHSAVKRFAMSL